MTYLAVVSKLNDIRKHPNADRLNIAICSNGYQVLIGLEHKEGELGVLFTDDGQLSFEFCVANNLMRKFDPETGKNSGGLFDNRRRIQCQKIRGEKSEAFWIPVNSLIKVGVSQEIVSKLKEGDSFNKLDNIAICNKYITDNTKNVQSTKHNQAKKKVKVKYDFPEHYETRQLLKEINYILDNVLVYLTYKMHGTSGRYGRVKIIYTKWYQKLLRYFNLNKEYKNLIGSRRVIINKNNNDGFYKTNDFRTHVMEGKWHLIRDNEIIYGEIVGYCNSNTSIMPRVDASKLDKKFIKKYNLPKIMTYDYGCKQGEHDFYVYRITLDNKDLSWKEVKERCKELGFKHVIECSHLCYDKSMKEFLLKLIEDLATGVDPLDNEHIKEGIVVRIESFGKDPYFLKYKSFEFKVLEGIIKDNDNYIDIEESS